MASYNKLCRHEIISHQFQVLVIHYLYRVAY